MATNDTQTSYARIGFVLLAGLVAIGATLFYLGGLETEDVIQAEMYYDKPVSGLSVGSPVNFRGVQIGTVKDITFVGSEYPDAAPEDWQTILVRLAFDVKKFRLDPRDQESPDQLVRRVVESGLHATVTAAGVTGLSRIELDMPAKPIQDRTISWTPKTPCFPPALSFLDAAADTTTQILDKINAMDLKAGWDNVQSMTQSGAGLLKRIEALEIETAWSNVLATTAAAAKTMDKFNSVDLAPTMKNVEEATASAARTAAQTEKVVGEATTAVAQVNEMLVENRATLRRILENLEEASLSVKELAAELKANPSLILRARDQEPLPETTR